MIPTREQSLLLWDKYNLPSPKRIHMEAVAKLAFYLAKKITDHDPRITIDLKLLEAAALLHDIDKNVTKREGERHPDTAVRILKELGFNEVAEVVRKHPLHSILDPTIAPKTWEEKLLYLADKMTKYEVIGVEHRFKLWYMEKLPPDAFKELDAALPKVKALEKEILEMAGLTFEQIRTDSQTI